MYKNINYIELINHFWKLNKERSFSPPETQLYFKLLDTSNSLGWKNPFNHSNRFLMGEIMVTEKTLIKARRRLKESGLINYISGQKKRENTVYTILIAYDYEEYSSTNGSINDSESYSQKDSKTNSQNDSQNDSQKGSITGKNTPDNTKRKLNKTKLNKKKKETKVSSSSRDDKAVIVQNLFDKYNEICKNLPRSHFLTDKRKIYIGARLAEHGYDTCIKMLQMAPQSDYLGRPREGYLTIFRFGNIGDLFEYTIPQHYMINTL